MTLEARPDDDELATAFTIARMNQISSEDATNEIVQRAAYEANAERPDCPVAAVHSWIRRHVQFQPDSVIARLAGLPNPDKPEVLIRPVELLTMPRPAGDCDCISTLAASMLRALGTPSAFKTSAANPEDPGVYSHVYVIAQTARGPLALDASHGPYPGWEVQPVGKARVWPTDGGHMRPRTLGDDYTWWQDLLGTGMKATSSILTSRFAVPQLNPGQYMQQGNSILYQQPTGAGALSLPGTSPGGSSEILLLGGAAVVVLMIAMMSKRG